MIEFCKCNNVIMLMTCPIGNSHAIAVRDEYVIDSLHPSERFHVKNFNFSLLDRNQIYYVPSDNIKKIYKFL